MQRVNYQISLYPLHENRKIKSDRKIYQKISGVVVVVVLALYGSITTCRKYKGTSSMDWRERGSHARVYPTQYTLRMGTAKVKQEVGANTRITVKRVVRNMERRSVSTMRAKVSNKA